MSRFSPHPFAPIPGGRITSRAVLVTFALIGLCPLVTGCGQTAGATRTRSAARTGAPAGTHASAQTQGSSAAGWRDQPVTFSAGGMRIYGTYRHPSGQTKALPAVLLIAGSGPTDRNGNSPALPGQVNTLRELADWLSADGVATLRYDKLGSGQTGAGRYASDPAAIGIAPFEQEAAAGLRFLAHQSGVDRARLGVFGHSEGALFALLLANGAGGPVPAVHALGLLEPLSERYLTVIETQIRGQVVQAERAGKLTSTQGTALERELVDAVGTLRRTGHVSPDLPGGISSVLNADTAKFLRQADQYDPARLAARLPARFPVLLTCSDADIQVSCGEVDHLAYGVHAAHAASDLVHLHGVDHVLKQDASRTGANYGAALPFSPALRAALARWVHANL